MIKIHEETVKIEKVVCDVCENEIAPSFHQSIDIYDVGDYDLCDVCRTLVDHAPIINEKVELISTIHRESIRLQEEQRSLRMSNNKEGKPLGFGVIIKGDKGVNKGW